MGTPQFAVPSLKMLIEDNYEICCVVTQPDRRKGRNATFTMPPVKELAILHGVPVLQPINIKSDDVFCELSELKPDIIITVAYGGILSKRILDIPRLGCINVHGSLLPKYRGPAPIQWALINGESETGVTTMLMDEGVDTGRILLMDSLALTKDIYYPEAHDKLSELGANTLRQTLSLWASGRITPQSQDETLATRARMLVKEDGVIDPGKSAVDVVNLVRGLNPWPGTYLLIENAKIKVLRAHIEDGGDSNSDRAQIEPESKVGAGSVISVCKDGLTVKCGCGAISITRLQFENGRAMDIAECWHNLKFL
jgi:methionyl-tRNA formyltransferase